MRTPQGFTLIELLVVIAIIGLLSSVILASLAQARMKSRVAKRYADFHQVQVALENYFDANGSYPSTSNTWLSVCKSEGDGPWGRDRSGANGYIPNLAPTYIGILPVDPTGCLGVGVTEGYHYTSNGSGYKFQTAYFYDDAELCLPGGTYADPSRLSNSGAYVCAFFTPEFAGR